MPLEPGEILNGRYKIDCTIAKGGMGSVYRAIDQILNVPVAVKENLFSTEGSTRQFKHEATILAGVKHPNLPRVTDHFAINKVGQYLVMDFIEGEDLREQIKRIGKLPEEEVIRIGGKICDALTYLHNSDPPILHRDIKPGNIKITPTGEIFLVDFGLAKMVQGNQATTTGAQSLTPGYAPPEQYGTGTSQRSDIYSLGATLYAALTGKIPEDGIGRAMGTTRLTPIARHNPFVTPKIAQAIEKSMAVAPEDRFQSAEEFKKALSLELRSTVTIKKKAGFEKEKLEIKSVPASLPHQTRKKTILPIFTFLGLAIMGIISILIIKPSWFIGIFKEQPTSTPETVVSQMDMPTKTAQMDIPPTETITLTLPPTVNSPTETLVAESASMVSGLIAFASDRDGAPQIYVMEIDGSNVRRVTNLPDGACQPEWSPDSKKLVFISPCEGNKAKYAQSSLFTINVEGSGLLPLKTIPGGDYEPDWSPDGSKLIFTTLRDGLPHLYYYDLENESTTRLSSPSSTDRSAAWSPDGKLIAFESNRLGQPVIFLMDLESGRIQQVSQLENGNSYLPNWSPDGKALVYSQGSSQPWLVITQLIGLRVEETQVNDDFRPANDANFSPDGTNLVCESNGDIFILNRDGTIIQNLTENPANDFDPAWSP